MSSTDSNSRTTCTRIQSKVWFTRSQTQCVPRLRLERKGVIRLRAILFVTISDSPVAHNLFRESKKVGYGCPYYFRETDSQYLNESRKIVYMGYRRYIPMKQQFRSMKDEFNGNTERRSPPPHLTGHEVYEMVKDVYVVLGKQKRIDKKTELDDMWKKESIFLGVIVLERLRRPSFDSCD
jgi:hypothetical protein